MSINWTSDKTFAIDDVVYECCPMLTGGFASEPGRFCLVKPRSAVLAYEKVVTDLAPKRIIELGMFDGASAALIAEIAQPDKLVGIDRREIPSVALSDFIVRRGLENVVSAHYGVDQGDAHRLRSIVTKEFGDHPVDLIIDDASHLLDLTRRSFNTLFPFLRPGGTYLIEDWWWAHADFTKPLRPEETPPTVLVFELILAAAYAPGVVAQVTADREWVSVVRGNADLDPDTFDIADNYGKRGRDLVTPLRREDDA